MISLAHDRDDEPHEDHFVVLAGATWDDYERLLEVRGDHSAPRITYFEGLLQIMSPSSEHESIKSIVGCLVEVYCLEHDIEFSTVGSWTLKDRRQKVGAEPDECYVFGPSKHAKRPDLAIEIVWTSDGIDKLDVYRKLGVREVWYWRKGKLVPFVLVGKSYVERRASQALPGIDLGELARYLDRPTTSAAIRAYRNALLKRAR
ncbi:MAG TPA: Uma2 family endonuclease [Kofleriaceae bacterium]|jgi:Uma2 family endonuclease